jgi:hypothetical protein
MQGLRLATENFIHQLLQTIACIIMARERIVRAYIAEVWNQKKIDLATNYIHWEYKIYADAFNPWEKTTLHHSDFKDMLENIFHLTNQIDFRIDSLMENDLFVGITWNLNASFNNTSTIREEDNQFYTFKGMTTFQFKEDLICGHTQLYLGPSIFEFINLQLHKDDSSQLSKP